MEEIVELLLLVRLLLVAKADGEVCFSHKDLILLVLNARSAFHLIYAIKFEFDKKEIFIGIVFIN